MNAKINTMNFVNAAVSTTVENIKLVYSDKGRLVGTDGKRLHMGPKPKTPGYTGYLQPMPDEQQFPNYKDILYTKEIVLGDLLIEKNDLRVLKALVSLVKVYDKVHFACTLSRRSSRFTISFDNKLPPTKVDISLDTFTAYEEAHISDWSVTLNLHYMLNALEQLCYKSDLTKITIKSNKNCDLDDIRHYISLEVSEHIAIIMPVKLTK